MSRRALAGALGLLAGRAAGALLATVWLVVAARAFDASTFGRLAVVLGIGTVASVVAEGGFPVLVAHAIGAEPARARAVVRSALRARMPLAAGAAGFTALAGFLVWGSTGGAVGLAYGGWIIASAVQTTVGPAQRALGSVGSEALGEVFSRAAALGVGVPLLAIWSSPVAVTIAYAVGTTTAAVGLAISFRSCAPAPAGDSWAVSGRQSATLSLVAVVATLYNRMDVWLLAALATSTEAGVYAAAYRLYEGLVLPGPAFGALLVPAVAQARGAVLARRTVIRHVVFAASMTAVGAVVAAGMAPLIVNQLFGPRYEAATSALRVLAVAAVPATVLAVVAPLASLRLRRAGVPIYVGGLVGTTLLNVALIPAFGADGAAGAMVVSQTALAAAFALLTLRALDEPRNEWPGAARQSRTTELAGPMPPPSLV